MSVAPCSCLSPPQSTSWPQAGVDRSGNRFAPTKGEQYEAGIRYQPHGSDPMFSAALYQLTQQNVLATGPVDTSFSIQTGEIRSRGLEREARGKLGEQTNVIASYAHTDARVTADTDASNIGKRRGMVPNNQASLWLDYDFGRWGMKKLKAGAGVRYVGDTLGLYVAGTVPSYTLIMPCCPMKQGHGVWRSTAAISVTVPISPTAPTAASMANAAR